ncbi:S-methyl-5-thioribose-1-phosphate isomerase [Deltaproteobacteria bacterium TL4]
MIVNGESYRTIWFEENTLKLIYQPILPHQFEIRSIKTHQEAAQAIEEMWVRGAPAIGAAGAFGMTLAILEANASNFQEYAQTAAARLRATRPTAKNLFVGIERVLQSIQASSSWSEACKNAISEAQAMADSEVKASEAIGKTGSALIKDGDSILTHCNAGWLACVDWGTAIAPIYWAAQEGKKNFVFVDETRPRGQGSRLTAWELGQEGIKHTIIADNAAGYYLSKKQIQLALVGADRIAANGDVANKIGTYEKAVVAKACNVPFYVAAPLSTIDFQCASGKDIPIEERSPDEVLYTWGVNDADQFVRVRTAPATSTAKNPAFDVTPAEYITGIITERGIFAPDSLSQLQS